MKVLVTGASGFVGSHLLPELLRAGHRPFATTFAREEIRERYPPTRWFVLHVEEEDGWTRVLDAVRPDAVIHLAGLADVGRSWRRPLRYLQVNFLGTAHMFAALQRLNLRPRVVIIGSAEIYGRVPPDENPVTERRCPAPGSPYGTSKACQEILALQWGRAAGIEVIATRPFNHIGPGQGPGFVAADFAARIARIEAGLDPPVLRVGNLEAVRDFTDVRDVVRAYRLLLERGEPGTAYNICTGTGRSIRSLVEDLLRRTDRDIEVRVDPELVRPLDLPVLIGSPDRLQRATGWTPRVAWSQTLSEILDDWRRRVRSAAETPPPAP